MAKGIGHKFCSRKCSRGYWAVLYGIDKLLPCGTVGAIAELVVATDLLKKGYDVFRALSPHCSCDLAILKNRKLYRIEVRNGYRLKNGKTCCTNKHINADILALYIRVENLIIYTPELTP